MDCPNLAGCGFVKKFNESKSLAVKGFISQYCKGEKQVDCVRKQYKAKNGVAPPDEMMPSGGMMR